MSTESRIDHWHVRISSVMEEARKDGFFFWIDRESNEFKIAEKGQPFRESLVIW